MARTLKKVEFQFDDVNVVFNFTSNRVYVFRNIASNRIPGPLLVGTLPNPTHDRHGNKLYGGRRWKPRERDAAKAADELQRLLTKQRRGATDDETNAFTTELRLYLDQGTPAADDQR